jgi:hypothetical protein
VAIPYLGGKQEPDPVAVVAAAVEVLIHQLANPRGAQVTVPRQLAFEQEAGRQPSHFVVEDVHER